MFLSPPISKSNLRYCFEVISKAWHHWVYPILVLMNGTILVLEIFPSLMDVNGILPVKKIEYCCCFTFVYLPEKSIWSFFCNLPSLMCERGYWLCSCSCRMGFRSECLRNISNVLPYKPCNQTLTSLYAQRHPTLPRVHPLTPFPSSTGYNEQCCQCQCGMGLISRV